MPSWLNIALQVLVMTVLVIIFYKLLKSHILHKFYPNKWLILILAIGAFFLPPVISAYFKYNLNGTIWQYISSAVFLILFLWFVDLKNGGIYKNGGKSSKGKDIKIRPKAKPNRANRGK
ncbi:hypothetical protein [Clostridium kluyveri]|uniref:Uncharacterized protein n=1 Tax=Clostridium kluyveri TaxID=1534 RepID=A0A1L5F5W5_CLOKL|nr:hypothetical protein [Clostridium kluyveri]APM38367.1 hypothetical protein BS101_06270 [Clostridium kluyveri]UZQ50649.1 hypothetical protein OP486_00275 [Clostridium kluyveri]